MATGKRAGARPPRRLRPDVAGLAAGITLLVVGWGYLVYAAIDFGSSARGGENRAWIFLALASVGAIACLFAGLMLVARLFHVLTATVSTSHAESTSTESTSTERTRTESAPSPSRHRADIDPQ